MISWVKSKMGSKTQSWRVALTLGDGREGLCRGTYSLLFSGEEERHINHPKTSVVSATLEFCQSAPDFPPIAEQKNGKKRKRKRKTRTGIKSQKKSHLFVMVSLSETLDLSLDLHISLNSNSFYKSL